MGYIRSVPVRGLCWAIMLLATVPVAAQQATIEPPVAKKSPTKHTWHGVEHVDEYFWLREKGTPEVTAYLNAENAYSAAMTKPLTGLANTLYKEMLGRIKQTDLSVPYVQRGYWYYSRTMEGKQYPVPCRRKGSMEGPEEILIDLNAMAKPGQFLSLGGMQVSDDNQMLAYSLDETGFREYTLHLRELKTGKDLPFERKKTSSFCWAADNNTVFYVTDDAAKRAYRLHRHELGNENDALLYEEKDELFRVGVGRSDSRKFVMMQCGSMTARDARFLPADQPNGEWKIVCPREKDLECDVEHHGDLFYIRTNNGGRNFRLVTAPINNPGKENWKEIIPHRADVMLEGMSFFADHYILREREGGLQKVIITNLKTGESHSLKFDEEAYAIFPAENAEFETTKFRYNYTSFVTPRSIYEYDMNTRESKLLKRVEVLGGYDPSQYETKRIFATAKDGTKIPISIVAKKGRPMDGNQPLYLNAYGSYGIPSMATFDSNRISLLDRGVAYAVAHIRGGSELGKAWHDQGRMMNKKNTFSDFIACAECLIEQKYTSKDRLGITGGSAGGLLMGAVLNDRPDLFKVAMVYVPFVDVINTMMDASLPLTVTEYEEWGNPNEKPAFDYMSSYCPYTNLAAKNYPTILVRTSLNDSQVMYWEPAKYVAKLRSLKTDKNPLLLMVNMAGGHGGSSGRYDVLRNTSLDYAFLLTQLGVK